MPVTRLSFIALRRIYKAHESHRGVTDIFSLHRLYLQYVRQWHCYGAAVFPCQLAKYKRGGIRLAKSVGEQESLKR